MNKVGNVVAINISEKKGVIKTPIPEGEFKEEYGLVGDVHAGKGHRQVSLLGQESIDKMKALGIDGLCTGKFTENITTQGIILPEFAVGTRLEIGETIQEVTQIGKECHRGCEIRKQIGDCIMPRECIFTRVIRGGVVRTGDNIKVMVHR